LISCPDDGIVVVEVEKGDVDMDSNAVPAALRERLGAEGTNGLVSLLETVKGEWTAEVVSLSLDRFERRLVEELSTLRVELARGQATLREEIARGQATVREELARESAALRVEIADLRTDLKGDIATLRTDLKGDVVAVRGDLQQGFAAVRQEVTDNRFELLKWSFLFWIGQVIAVVGPVRVMLRTR
jgi:hypothetical protein